MCLSALIHLGYTPEPDREDGSDEALGDRLEVVAAAVLLLQLSLEAIHQGLVVGRCVDKVHGLGRINRSKAPV